MMMTNQHVAEGREPSGFGDTERLAPFREVGVSHVEDFVRILTNPAKCSRWIMASA